jgi:hypothetical protein
LRAVGVVVVEVGVVGEHSVGQRRE